ncbi:MAG: restriction endonuclease subunit S [Nitrosopumilaceae archaeon]|nr:restriction endonuclease subunit S [Nitrosopumilaceae archaeon]
MVTEQLTVKSGYKKTEVGIIPEEWDIQQVKDSFEICNTLRLPISKNVRKKMKGSYPYYGPTGVQDHINEYRVDGEYALIGEDGDHFLKWRNQPMTLFVKGKFNVNNHAHVVKGTKNLTEWFYWYFNNKDITQHLTKQGAGRLKLSKASLKKILCFIPPIIEQENVSKTLTDIDFLVSHFQKIVKKKIDMKRATMQYLLTGQKQLTKTKRNFKKTEFGNIPEDWERRSLISLSTIQSGGTPSTIIKKFWKNGNIPWINSSKLKDKEIRTPSKYITQIGLENSAAKIFPKNSTLIALTGATTGKIGYLSFDCSTNQSITAILPSKLHDSKFLFYQLQLFRKNILSHAIGSAQPHINQKIVENFQTFLPKLSEQNTISTILSDMDSEIQELEEKRDKYIKIKNGMMQKLLTGEIRLT